MQFIQATSTKKNGNMSFLYGEQPEVITNRKNFLSKLQLKAEDCVVMDSQHGSLVTILDEKNYSEYRGINHSLPADTLITRLKNAPLLLTTADCLPISFFDHLTGTIALAHISRHTFGLGLIEKTLKQLTELGTIPQTLEVQIGPHIHKNSYSFPLPLKNEDPLLIPYISKNKTTAYIDLAGAVTQSLIKLSVPPAQIRVSAIDTYQNSEYFSHLESVQKGSPEGRLATVICIL